MLFFGAIAEPDGLTTSKRPIGFLLGHPLAKGFGSFTSDRGMVLICAYTQWPWRCGELKACSTAFCQIEYDFNLQQLPA